MTYQKKLGVLIILVFITILQASSQGFEFENYNFDQNNIEIPDSLRTKNEVILLRNLKIELMASKDEVKQYYLLHEKIMINTDNAIERNNKVYIPFRIDEKLLTIKLRVIQKNGDIIELKKTDIKEEINQENGVKYNYFAVNGLDKGSIIEKLFILEEFPEFKGKTIMLQENTPVLHTSFELIYPDHLRFKYKSYNGLPTAAVNDSVYKDKHQLMVSASFIDAFPEEESYSNVAAHAKMFRYKLDENLAFGTKNINNYREFSGNVYENLHVEVDKKDEKLLQKYFDEIPSQKEIDDKISALEQKIKTTITYNQFFNGNERFSDCLKTKQANEVDLLKLFIVTFKKFEIEYQIVMTSPRYKLLFDKDFETVEQIGDVLFYFPATKKYLEPLAVEFRYPLFNFNYGNNYGLFIKEKEFGGAKMGVGEIGFIEIPNEEVTHDFTHIEIDFSENPENPKVHTIHKGNGYAAASYQIIKDYVPDDQYRTIIQEIAENYTQKAEYTTLKSENDGSQNIGKKPFIIDVSFDGKDLIQKAGENILCHVGVLIGKQMELYQVEKRVLPVEIYYPHKYTRTIKLTLPENYVLQNPDVFNMQHSASVEGKVVAFWESKAEVKGREVYVTNTESYTAIHYPLEIFEKYKEVVNAAADFNKIVVVLGKK